MRLNYVRTSITTIAAVGVGFGLASQALAQPAPPSDDTPEEIAKHAERELKDSCFYNPPGATRSKYYLRLAGMPADRPLIEDHYLQHHLLSSSHVQSVDLPLAAGVGGGIGAAIGAVIAEGIQRRENRKRCLMIKGGSS